MKRIISIIVFIFLCCNARAQFRELIYFKIPVGEIKYFHVDDKVIYKLKSDDKYSSRKGSVTLITDTLYGISNIRFRPDNLEWMSTQFTSQQKLTKTIVGSIFLAGGIATLISGIIKIPSSSTQFTDTDFSAKYRNAYTISAIGIAVAAISIPIYTYKPKKYSVSKKWGVKYQH